MNVPHLGPCGGRIEKDAKKALGFGCGSTERGRRFHSLRSFGTCKLPVQGCSNKCHCLPGHRSARTLEHEKNGEKRETESPAYSLHSIWTLGVSFPHLEPEAEGVFWDCPHDSAYFNVSGYNFRLKDTEVKNTSKLLTGLATLWIQLFFCNTLADIYFSVVRYSGFCSWVW